MSATFSRMMAELAGWCVMNNIFNTSFEISLRVLLTLESAPLQWWTADLIAASDFITVYSGDFDIATENLHGVNSFKYSEFALRREMVKEALKALVARKLTDVKLGQDGFVYTLSKSGGDYCGKIESSYAQSYRELAAIVRESFADKTDREILRLINRNSISSLRGGNYNG